MDYKASGDRAADLSIRSYEQGTVISPGRIYLCFVAKAGFYDLPWKTKRAFAEFIAHGRRDEFREYVYVTVSAAEWNSYMVFCQTLELFAYGQPGDREESEDEGITIDEPKEKEELGGEKDKLEESRKIQEVKTRVPRPEKVVKVKVPKPPVVKRQDTIEWQRLRLTRALRQFIRKDEVKKWKEARKANTMQRYANATAERARKKQEREAESKRKNAEKIERAQTTALQKAMQRLRQAQLTEQELEQRRQTRQAELQASETKKQAAIQASEAKRREAAEAAEALELEAQRQAAAFVQMLDSNEYPISVNITGSLQVSTPDLKNKVVLKTGRYQARKANLDSAGVWLLIRLGDLEYGLTIRQWQQYARNDGMSVSVKIEGLE